MNPSVLVLLLHVGSIIAAVKDIEKGVADVVSGKATSADAAAVINDVLSLVTSGVINIPGLTADQLAKVVADVKAAL